jgi:hypothetical protein
LKKLLPGQDSMISALAVVGKSSNAVMVGGKMDRKRRTRSKNTKNSAAVRIGCAVLKETKSLSEKCVIY